MNARRGLGEIGLFAAAAIMGVYGLGEGLDGFFEPGHGSVLWLGVAAVALMVLAKQMARIQDRWPRRGRRASGRTTLERDRAVDPIRRTDPAATDGGRSCA